MKAIIKSKYGSLLIFFVAMIWMVIGSVFFMIPMITITSAKTGIDIIDISSNASLIMDISFVPSCIAYVLGIIAICYIYEKEFKNDFSSFKQNVFKFILIIVIFFAILQVMTRLLDYIYRRFDIGSGGTSANQQAIIDSLNGSMKEIVIIFTVILAPIFEEMIFRRLLFKALKDNTKFNTVLIVIIVAVIFAGIHVLSDFKNSVIYFPIYFALSLIITASYAISKENLLVSTSLHFLNNLFSIIEIL